MSLEEHPLDVLAEACAISAELKDLQAGTKQQVTELAQRRRALWLVANRGGVPYRVIAEECGVHPSFVTNEVSRARNETSDVLLSARGPRSRPKDDWVRPDQNGDAS